MRYANRSVLPNEVYPTLSVFLSSSLLSSKVEWCTSVHIEKTRITVVYMRAPDMGTFDLNLVSVSGN